MTYRTTVVMTSKNEAVIVSQAQLKMLRYIKKNPGALYSDVADHIQFDKPSVVTYASRMERVGLVKRSHEQIGWRTYATLRVVSGVDLSLKVMRV